MSYRQIISSERRDSAVPVHHAARHGDTVDVAGNGPLLLSPVPVYNNTTADWKTTHPEERSGVVVYPRVTLGPPCLSLPSSMRGRVEPTGWIDDSSVSLSALRASHAWSRGVPSSWSGCLKQPLSGVRFVYIPPGMDSHSAKRGQRSDQGQACSTVSLIYRSSRL